MIGVVDYGMGNLFSVQKALERLDVPHIVSEDPVELERANGLILPGVGAFPDAMKRLNETGLSSFLVDFVESGRPLFGICLGMQLLFTESEEFGTHIGLGFLPGRVVKFAGKTAEGQSYKVPHMGWNRLEFQRESSLTKDVDEGYAYFVHSYVVEPENRDVLVATADYYREVPAVVSGGKYGHVFGAQFHPEKSSTVGMQLLKRFTQLANQEVTRS
ncbi:imidazole glycerol phosphate synthase subunit HisH [Bacillus fonticola]|uniref:imidazole glycerol phosphate synthase subunit HisH n=1 Tax=Bacillus fonticola TaxID=2728853 RepID=UPI00147556A4|nr:imidazole glycerol phosphate synthase subunit HisH [Bacillus fonticola]